MYISETYRGNFTLQSRVQKLGIRHSWNSSFHRQRKGRHLFPITHGIGKEQRAIFSSRLFSPRRGNEDPRHFIDFHRGRAIFATATSGKPPEKAPSTHWTHINPLWGALFLLPPFLYSYIYNILLRFISFRIHICIWRCW